MSQIILFLFLGLTAGSAYALIGQGLVMTYRGSGVVILAQGALAMVAAYQYVWFTDHGWRPGAAAAATIVGAAVVGGLLYLLFMRPLRDAPVLAKLVATLGLLLVCTFGVGLVYGTAPRRAEHLVPREQVTLLGETITRDRLYLAGIAIALCLVLAVISQRTAAGWLLRGASESEEGVTLLGYSLDLVAGATWVIGSALAALAGILIAPSTTVDVAPLTFLVIPALAAALLARFSSFLVVTAAGLALGFAQSLLPLYWSQQGIEDALPLLIIVLAMTLRGRLIPDRNVVREGRPPIATRAIIRWPVVLVLSAVVILGLGTMSGVYRAAIITTMITAIVALSLVVITGYVGQISLMQMTFAGIGALVTSRLADGWGVPFPLSIVLAAVITAPIGVLLGLPALRVRGINLAIVTLGAAVAVNEVVFKNSDFTGGVDGSRVPDAEILGFSLNATRDPFRYGIFVLLVLVACLAAVSRLRQSTLGLRMLAVRDNERAAAAEGVSLARTKLLAFAMSAALAALAGALQGYQLGQISFERFAPLASIQTVATTYIGGIGSIAGAVFAGVMGPGGLFFQLFRTIGSIERYIGLVAGMGVLLAAILHPDGVATTAARLVPRFLDRKRFAPAATGVPVDVRRIAPDPASGDGASGSGTPLLELREVSVTFGAVRAVDRVSSVVHRGEFVGLIGPNGAGKTTLVDAIGGYVPAAGQVLFDGEAIEGRSAHHRARLGLRRTFQAVELFEDLTIEENLLVGSGRHDASDDVVRAALEAVGLDRSLRCLPRELSNAERKLVGVARALAGRPKLLMLDEPAASLDSEEGNEFGDRLRSLLGLGVTLVMIDHDLELVLRICERIDVMDQGVLIASGTPAEIRSNVQVRAAYIGDPIDSDRERLETPLGAR